MLRCDVPPNIGQPALFASAPGAGRSGTERLPNDTAAATADAVKIAAKIPETLGFMGYSLPTGPPGRLVGLNRGGGLLQNLLHHIPMHIRQPMVAALVAIRQAAVIDSQAVQHRRVQVVDMDRVLVDVV